MAYVFASFRPRVMLTFRQYIIAYPISKGKLVNFVAFVTRHELENTKFQGPWVSTCDRSVFAGVFAHWEPEVQMLISASLLASYECPVTNLQRSLSVSKSLSNGRSIP